MKKEILTLHNVYAKRKAHASIEDVNVSIYEKDVVCLVGTTDSGKDLLFDVLSGREKDVEGTILIEGKRLNKGDHKQVVIISDIVAPFPIDDWLVYEYLLMENHGTWSLLFVKKDKAAALAQEFLDLIQCDISPKARWRDLTQTEKLILSFLRAYMGKKKLILLEYGFDGHDKQDFDLIKQQMNRFSEMGLTILINCNSVEVSMFLGERFLVFKEGRICKKCKNADIVKKLMENFFGKTSNYHMQSGYETKTLHCLHSKNQNILINKGELVVLIEKDYAQKKKVFDSLSARRKILDYRLIYEGQHMSASSVEESVRNKIVSIGRLDRRSELIENLSIAENLLLPSIRKVSNRIDIFPTDVIKALEKQAEKLNISPGKKVRQLTDLEYLTVLFERWYIFQPKVLILLEPFLFCDSVQTRAIMQYIEKFIAMGTGVILITSNDVNIVTPNL
jgi:ABC-type sugar transport system ATPase subunit